MVPGLSAEKNSVYSFDDRVGGSLSDLLEIQDGLAEKVKRISPKFFYDDEGQRLFDLICETEDYYVTRAEREILTANAGEIADLIGGGVVLIEPGSGNCSKVECLLTQVRPRLYVPIDISADALRRASERLVSRFEWLNCTAVAADFSDLSFLEATLPPLRRVVFYPGSTIGNFEPASAIEFLKNLRKFTGFEGGLLIGVDMEKNPAILERAYNDRDSITEMFNLNILNNVNRITGSRFDPANFEHQAFYDSRKHRVEMHLLSRLRQLIMVGDMDVLIGKGECIHTENSYKYSTESFSALAAEAGFARVQTWYDRKRLFSVHYLVADERLVDQAENGEVISMRQYRRFH